MCQKIKYGSRAEALKDILIIKNTSKRYSKRFKDAPKNSRKLTPYECRVCGFWHLTSQPKRKY